MGISLFVSFSFLFVNCSLDVLFRRLQIHRLEAIWGLVCFDFCYLDKKCMGKRMMRTPELLEWKLKKTPPRSTLILPSLCSLGVGGDTGTMVMMRRDVRCSPPRICPTTSRLVAARGLAPSALKAANQAAGAVLLLLCRRYCISVSRCLAVLYSEERTRCLHGSLHV